MHLCIPGCQSCGLLIASGEDLQRCRAAVRLSSAAKSRDRDCLAVKSEGSAMSVGNAVGDRSREMRPCSAAALFLYSPSSLLYSITARHLSAFVALRPSHCNLIL